jgi:hypothetical protein
VLHLQTRFGCENSATQTFFEKEIPAHCSVIIHNLKITILEKGRLLDLYLFASQSTAFDSATENPICRRSRYGNVVCRKWIWVPLETQFPLALRGDPPACRSLRYCNLKCWPMPDLGQERRYGGCSRDVC